jgi:hypothetical protein
MATIPIYAQADDRSTRELYERMKYEMMRQYGYRMQEYPPVTTEAPAAPKKPAHMNPKLLLTRRSA